MSETTEPRALGSQISLFDHAARLHETAPYSPLPRDGEPFPDNAFHRRRDRPRAPHDRRSEGADVAAILDGYFADQDAAPDQLVHAFQNVYVPFHRNDHIAAAARRADEDRVRQTGRLLRSACDGEFLNGYFAGKVATAAHLHEAITATDADDDLIDHTGRLLIVMACYEG